MIDYAQEVQLNKDKKSNINYRLPFWNACPTDDRLLALRSRSSSLA
jgi:hypothetical protein